MSKQHVVRLTAAEREDLTGLLRRDDPGGFTLRRARILLHADVGDGRPYQTDLAVATATAVDPRTVARVRAQFAAEGLAATLVRRPSARVPARRLDSAAEARVVQLACSAPPPGHARWSLRLLADRIVALEIVDGISPETVRQTLKKTT
jgi:hypothetical protein